MNTAGGRYCSSGPGYILADDTTSCRPGKGRRCRKYYRYFCLHSLLHDSQRILNSKKHSLILIEKKKILVLLDITLIFQMQLAQEGEKEQLVTLMPPSDHVQQSPGCTPSRPVVKKMYTTTSSCQKVVHRHM